jgi:hypothetical protein
MWNRKGHEREDASDFEMNESQSLVTIWKMTG